jgi:ferredoxin
VASPFEVLGVDPDADEATVDRAYRRRVMETHPDQGGSMAAFQEVRDAYDAIKAGEVPDPEATMAAAEAAREDGGTAAADPGGGPPPAGATNGTAGTEPTADPETDDPEGARVEFLNYDVLVDNGWELTDDDLFEKASEADLAPEDHGRFLAPEGDTLLSAAEDHGFAWPYACRGGACANCAVAILEGELDMPNDQILPDGMVEDGIRLSCFATPVSDEMKVVFNVKGLPGLDELRLPADRFEGSRGG